MKVEIMKKKTTNQTYFILSAMFVFTSVALMFIFLWLLLLAKNKDENIIICCVLGELFSIMSIYIGIFFFMKNHDEKGKQLTINPLLFNKIIPTKKLIEIDYDGYCITFKDKEQEKKILNFLWEKYTNRTTQWTKGKYKLGFWYENEDGLYQFDVYKNVEDKFYNLVSFRKHLNFHDTTGFTVFFGSHNTLYEINYELNGEDSEKFNKQELLQSYYTKVLNELFGKLM